ncbi:MAG: hypothetical protein AAGF98_00455 [Cyanobacteria bacterium P01_H01_bin.153]
MTTGNHWQTLPRLNWRHPIGSQAAALARSPLGRFTALSTADASAQSDQPLAAYLVGYPISPIEELRAAFSPETIPPFRFSLAAQELAEQPFEPVKIEAGVAPAIAPPSPPDDPPAAAAGDLPDLPPPLPAVQRQPLGRTTPLGSQVAAIAEAISGDLPSAPPLNINQPQIPSNDFPTLPDRDLPLLDATERPPRVPARWSEANRPDIVPDLPTPDALSPPAPIQSTETAAASDQPSPEMPDSESLPERPIPDASSVITPPLESAAPLADSPTLPDSDDAGVIQPRLGQSPNPPPAIAEPRSPDIPGDEAAAVEENQTPSQAWTNDAGTTGLSSDQAQVRQTFDPERDTSADTPGRSDAAATNELTELAAPPPLRPTSEAADSKSDTADGAAPIAPAAPESPALENSPDIEARSLPQLPSTDETTSPPPSSPAEPMQLHSSTEAGTTAPFAKAAISDSEAVDPAAIAPINRHPLPGSPPLPQSSDLPAQSIAKDSPSDSLRNLTPDGTPTPAASPTNALPTQLSRLEDSPISLPQNESATAPKIPLLPSIQRYVARTDGSPSRRLASDHPAGTQRSPLAELSDYLVPSTPQPSPRSPVPSLPKSPASMLSSSDEASALPSSTPFTQGLTVPTTQPPQMSRLPTLPVQMRALESPIASTWEPQLALEPDFSNLESTDVSLADLEPDDLTTEPEPATDESPGPAATSEFEAVADSGAVTLTADVGGAEADAELLDHLAEWVYGELRSHLCLRQEAQFGQSVALPPWYPQHPGLATQIARSEQNLPSLPLPPKLHQLTVAVRQQVESRLRQDWERFPEHRYSLRF